jgi:hypothetical protein
MVCGSSLGPADPNLKVGENETVEFYRLGFSLFVQSLVDVSEIQSWIIPRRTPIATA